MTTPTDTEAKAGAFDALKALFGGSPAPVKAAEPPAVAAPASVFDSAAFETQLLEKVGGLLDSKLAALKPAEPAKPSAPTTDAAALETRIGALMPDLEVLKPGIAKPAATMDGVTAAQRDALTAAVAAEPVLLPVLAGKTITTMDAAALDTAVPAAALMMRTVNDDKLRKSAMSSLAKIVATNDGAADFATKAKDHWGSAMGTVN